MSSQQGIVDFILEQIADGGVVSARKMFGEYGIYCDGKIVALICDDLFFVKPTNAGRTYIGNVTEQSPYQGAKPYFAISNEKWDDREWMANLVRITAAELPQPHKKSSSKR
jgi:TfoX/Sxy family transcriptional regulator of competence genes